MFGQFDTESLSLTHSLFSEGTFDWIFENVRWTVIIPHHPSLIRYINDDVHIGNNVRLTWHDTINVLQISFDTSESVQQLFCLSFYPYHLFHNEITFFWKWMFCKRKPNVILQFPPYPSQIQTFTVQWIIDVPALLK